MKRVIVHIHEHGTYWLVVLPNRELVANKMSDANRMAREWGRNYHRDVQIEWHLLKAEEARP